MDYTVISRLTGKTNSSTIIKIINEAFLLPASKRFSKVKTLESYLCIYLSWKRYKKH